MKQKRVRKDGKPWHNNIGLWQARRSQPRNEYNSLRRAPAHSGGRRRRYRGRQTMALGYGRLSWGDMTSLVRSLRLKRIC